jgi:hypothetical protein
LYSRFRWYFHQVCPLCASTTPLFTAPELAEVFLELIIGSFLAIAAYIQYSMCPSWRSICRHRIRYYLKPLVWYWSRHVSGKQFGCSSVGSVEWCLSRTSDREDLDSLQ